MELAENHVTISAAFPVESLLDGIARLDLTWTANVTQHLWVLIVAGEGSGLDPIGAQGDAGGPRILKLPLDASHAQSIDIAVRGVSLEPQAALSVLVMLDNVPIHKFDLQTTILPPASSRSSNIAVQSTTIEIDDDFTAPGAVLIVLRNLNSPTPIYSLIQPFKTWSDGFAYLGRLAFGLNQIQDVLRTFSNPKVPQPSDPDAAIIRDEARRAAIRDASVSVWRLLPTEFRTHFFKAKGFHTILFNQFHQPARSMLIASDEWSFPWELVAPDLNERPATAPQAKLPEFKMLGQRAAISRWPLGALPHTPISFKQSSLWGYSGLAPDLYEVESKRLDGFANRMDVAPLKTFRRDLTEEQMARAFTDTDHRIFHIKTHGDSTQLRLGNGETLTTDELRKWTSKFARRPGDPIFPPKFVFLNACGTAQIVRVEEDGASAGGWGKALFKHGCQAMILTYWTISELHSTTATRLFYDTLDSGYSIAEAMRVIRERFVSEPELVFGGDTTPLAYTVLGHPNATLKRIAV